MLSKTTPLFKTSVQTIDANYAGSGRSDPKPQFTNLGLRTREMTAVQPATTTSVPVQALHSNKQREQDPEHLDQNHHGNRNHLPDPSAEPG